jgi:hypothetical protein
MVVTSLVDDDEVISAFDLPSPLLLRTSSTRQVDICARKMMESSVVTAVS